MCKKCNHNDDLRLKLDKKVKTLNDSSSLALKSFSEWTNPFIDYKKFEKKSQEWYKKLKKFFDDKAEKFQSRYEEEASWVWFLWKVLHRTWIKKANPTRELTYEEIVAISNWLFNRDEFYEVVHSFYWEELPEWFQKELREWMVDVWIEDAALVTTINEQAQKNLTDYFYKWTGWYMSKVQAKLEDIVLFWFQDWKSTYNIAKEITNEIKRIWKDQAELIAQTESIRVSAEISIWTYKDIWVTHYEILPATTACPICKAKAAQNPYWIDDRSAMPPIHPRCRCSIIPVIEWLKKMLQKMGKI